MGYQLTGPRRGNTATNQRTTALNPWNALWAMMVGFFMILLDSTIVAVANPSIMARLHTGYDTVIWVTSAYLLAYAVPLLVAGRLGDRYGPKNLYLAGLAVFTAASLWCGLSGSIGMLIAARVVQGIGAALLTPQTLSMITRIFPPQRRGVAMSVWGATAGVATLVGPLVGGVLVDALGWEWIFFVNVPIGLIGLGLAVWLIPVLPTHGHRFDLIGVALSGVGIFLIVFALQEGQSGGWAPWVWAVIVAGVGLVTAFVYWQSINTREPLVPLDIFHDRDFSLSNLGVAVIGFAATAMVLPLMFYAQAVCGLSPTRSALLLAPMSIVSGLLAPMVGRIVDRYHPRPVVGFGFSVLAIALTWLSIELTPSTPIWRLAVVFTVLGVGMAFVWQPLAATATRNLPPHLAGASSGVYNAIRQLGAVLGSAGMAAFMTSRITAEMPPMPVGARPPNGQGAVLQLPKFLHEPFSAAMSQSMLLPAFIALFGVAAALFLAGSTAPAVAGRPEARPDAADARAERMGVLPTGLEDFDDGYDDDDYVEYTLPPPPGGAPSARIPDSTEPLNARVEHPRPAPDGVWHSSPVQERQHLLDERGPASEAEPVGFAHNGFHVDDEQHFRAITEFASPVERGRPRGADEHPFFDQMEQIYGDHAWHAGHEHPPRHQLHEKPPRNRHYRADPDDLDGYGRQFFPDS